VYPDEIYPQSARDGAHPEELDAGKKYYTDLNAPNGDGSNRPTARDGEKFGSERSAYILRITLPTFPHFRRTRFLWKTASPSVKIGAHVSVGIQLRSSTWTRPGERFLPDRWVYDPSCNTRSSSLATHPERLP